MFKEIDNYKIEEKNYNLKAVFEGAVLKKQRKIQNNINYGFYNQNEKSKYYLDKKESTEELLEIVKQIDSKLKFAPQIFIEKIAKQPITISLIILLAWSQVACNPTASNGSNPDRPDNGITTAATAEAELTSTITPEPSLREVEATATSVAQTEEAQTPEPTATARPNYIEMYKIDESEFENLDLQVIVELIQSEVGYEEGQTLHIDKNSQYIQLDNQDNNTIAIFDLEGNLLATLEEAQTIAEDLKLATPNDLGIDGNNEITADLVDEDGNSTKILLLAELEGETDKHEWLEYKKPIPKEAINSIPTSLLEEVETLEINTNGDIITSTLKSNGKKITLAVFKDGEWKYPLYENLLYGPYSKQIGSMTGDDNKSINFFTYNKDNNQATSNTLDNVVIIKSDNVDQETYEDVTREYVNNFYSTIKISEIMVYNTKTQEFEKRDLKKYQSINIQVYNKDNVPLEFESWDNTENSITYGDSSIGNKFALVESEDGLSVTIILALDQSQISTEIQILFQSLSSLLIKQAENWDQATENFNDVIAQDRWDTFRILFDVLPTESGTGRLDLNNPNAIEIMLQNN